ncbi:MAG TPA: chemotaxis protein CheW, partial [Erythrobacter sp.]|nr:chemotaxis protein CheW [Erythrobacter sp.]
LGWPPTETTPRNPIIVTMIDGQSRGLIVHDVSDIVSIDSNELQQPDTIVQDHITHFLEGVAPIGDDMVMVLDLKRLMGTEELELVA